VRALVIFFALLGCAGLWGWALMGARAAPEVPPELVGEFVLFDYRPPPGSQENPIAEGRTMEYEFRRNGTFTLRVLLDDGTETARFGGTIVPGGEGEVVLTAVSENAKAAEGPTERFAVIWAYDEEGEYLNLTQRVADGDGRQLLLRKKG